MDDTFLELFEDEIRKFKRIQFDNLVTDATVFLPIAKGPTAGVDFSKRMPGREGEEVKKEIQHFLLLRELKYSLLHLSDSMLPLKDHQTLLSDKLTPNSKLTTLDDKEHMKCSNIVLKGASTCRYLVVEGPFLLCVELQPKDKIYIVHEIIALQNLEVPLPFSSPLLFDVFYCNIIIQIL